MAEDPLKTSSCRCFLAVPLEALYCEELDSILGSLRRRISGVRWVERSQVHLTLHFFGVISLSDIERIDHSMREIAAQSSPLKLVLTSPGGFPDLERPAIVWLGVEDRTGTLCSFQKTLCKAVAQLGFTVEMRAFYPHATIGRVKGRVPGLKTLVEGILFRFPSAEKIADHFVLYQSHPRPEGVFYEVLKTYPFAKKT